MGVSDAEKDANDNKLGSGPVVGVDCDSEVDSRFGNQNYCDGYTKGYMGEANKLTAKTRVTFVPFKIPQNPYPSSLSNKL